MSEAKKTDLSISLLRVMAMMFIIICHLGNYFGKNIIAQFFNVGVHIFFLISGYLYGEKKIKNTSKWLISRYVRLIIPSTLWLLVTIIGRLTHNQLLPEIHEIVFLGLNLQGLNFIFSAMQDLFIGPWFFTNIMGCYILYAIYMKLSEKYTNTNNVFKWGGVIPLLIFSGLALLQISTDGALAFFIGVVLKQRRLLDCKKKLAIVISAICFTISVIIRLIGNRLMDGTIIYNEIISPVTHIGIACSLLIFVKALFNIFPKVFNRISSSYILRHLDHISIYVYIFHPMFYNGVIMDVFQTGIRLYLSIPIYLMLVLILASVMTIVGDFISKKANRFLDILTV